MFYIFKVTIDDVTKDLVAAKKFQQLIGDGNICGQKQNRQASQQVSLLLKDDRLVLHENSIKHLCCV